MAVRNWKKNVFFEKHEILIENLAGFQHPQGLTLYLCSDGFQDQFGGENNKKFMVKNLKKLLFEISDKAMNKQGEMLAQKFDEWKGEQKQTDDVTVLGIRI